MMTLTREMLLDYLSTNMGVDTNEIDDDTLLFSSMLLDSFSMIDLIMFIEKEANIKVKPTEVNLDNLDSIGRIFRFIESRT
jgi:acyl carrier protein